MSSSVFSASGVLLVLAFGLLLKWAYGLDRRRRPDVVAQVLARDVLEERPDPAFPRDPELLRQRNAMISTPSPASAGSAAEQAAARPEGPEREGVTVPRPARTPSASPRRAGGLRRGRAAVALAAAACLVLGLLGLILAPFTALTWPLPVFLLVLGLAGLAGLRYLALTERSAARAARPTVAAAPVEPLRETPAEPAEDAEPRRCDRGARPFDAQAEEPAAERTQRAEEAPLPARLPAAERDGAAAARDWARERQQELLREQARRVAAGEPVRFSPADATWQPVPVPRPTYADAAEIRRPAPEPLARPQTPASSARTLAEAEAKGRDALNLDDVLSRRRA